MTQNQGITFPSRGEVVVESKAMPDPDPDEVLIETERTLVSTGTELMYLTDSHPSQGTSLPFEPGYNNVGVVVEAGDAVADDAVGQRVANYGPHQRFTTANYDENCYPIPPAVGDDAAAFFTIAEIVMNGLRRGEVDYGEAVGVYGLGLLGQLTVRLAHFDGAHPVVGLDIEPDRLDYLPSKPGVVGVNSAEDDWRDRFDDRMDGRLADVVFEVTGNPDVIPSEFEILRDQGRLVVLGSPRGSSEFDFNRRCHNPGYTIVGAHNGTHPDTATVQNPWTRGRHVELFFELLCAGRLSVADLVSHRVHYDDAPDLYQRLLEDRSQALGVLVEW